MLPTIAAEIPLPNTVDARQVASGSQHSLALTKQGTIWVWGDNGSGQLGIRWTRLRTYPPTALASPTNVSAIAAGKTMSFAVCRDGSLWAWGENNYGQLGDGTTINRDQPTQIVTLAHVRVVAAGDAFTLAVTADGSVWSWGRNNVGQLGHGTISQQEATPRQINGLSNITSIVAGPQSALARDTDGNLWAWGANDYGQLGLGHGLVYIAHPREFPP
jgi:alpha-tubulin suppressor-like RCC1 family protein